VRSLARLLLITSLFVVGCGSDQTGFSKSDGGHPSGGPDAGLSAGGSGNGGAGGSKPTSNGGTQSAGGTTAQGGSGAMSMAGTGPGPGDAATGGTSGTPDSGSGSGGKMEQPDAATGGASAGTDSGALDSGPGGCPSGETSVGGKCLKDVLQTCTKATECGSGNCVGGVCCKVACDAPGACQKLDGTVCQNGDTCIYGPQMDGTSDAKCVSDKCSKPSTCFAGACTKGTPLDCADTDLCSVDTCDPAVGCTHTPIDVTKAGNACDDNNVCTTDTCSAAVGCQHGNADGVKAGCNDNNPCTTDICAGGTCNSTPLDCSSLTNGCNTGVCAAGVCKAQPANVNAACTLGLDACDTGGKCNASGACVASGNACGALSTACTPCTSGANCMNGRLCTCAQAAPVDIVVGGVCVANTDDCATNPCGAQGTACNDPTPNGSKKGDFTCTCAKGYGQKAAGQACTDVDECTGGPNPCVAGTCANTVGGYDCTCAAPLGKIQTATGPQCACNLSGTYALVANTTVSYPPISVLGIQTIEGSPAAGLPNVAWALRYNTIDAAKGTVTSQTVACGGTTQDLCDTAFGFAHAQYQPTQVYGQPAMISGFPTITTPLSGVVPGGAYTEAALVALSGIKLDNSAGAWPVCAECVGPTHPVGSSCTCPGGTAFTITNGAQWLNDPDGLGHLGFTTFDVPRGGVLTTAPNPPPFNYTEPSVCPRLRTGTKYGYAEFPGLATNNQAFLAYSWHAASRLQSTFKVDPTAAGQAISNTCSLSGGITGPDNGHAKAEARVQGCETCTTSDPAHPGVCWPTGACTQAQYDSYDKVTQNQQILAASFTLAPAPAGVGDLGAMLAMPDGAAKATAINNACALVRAAYPSVRK
jgi:hypothetical protein